MWNRADVGGGLGAGTVARARRRMERTGRGGGVERDRRRMAEIERLTLNEDGEGAPWPKCCCLSMLISIKSFRKVRYAICEIF